MTDDTVDHLKTGPTLDVAKRPFTYQKTGVGPDVLFLGDEALAADARITLPASELAHRTCDARA